MSDREEGFEKYYKEMLEMQRRAMPVEAEEGAEAPTVSEPERENHQDAKLPQKEQEKMPEAVEYYEESFGQSEEMPSLCPICAGGIALCEFVVENAKTGLPIENAQILLYRTDGFFVRVLTDEGGSSGDIPIFAEGGWHVSITSHGFVSVSKASVEPVAGEKITVPVRLDESISLDGVFTEHGDSVIGIKENQAATALRK